MKITLSRAHTISSRIGAELSRIQQKLRINLATAAFSTPPTEAQIAQLKERGAEAEEGLKLFEELVAFQARLREQIAQANAKVGVSARLARIQANKQVIALCDSYRENPAAVHVDDVAGHPWPAATAYGPTALEVTSMSPAWYSRLEETKKRLERENFRLNDEIAQLNQRTISIEIGDDLQEILGL